VPVALMTIASAIVEVRTSTAHDSDTQVTDTMITAQLNDSYRRTRRWLSTFLPELYAVSAAATIAAGANTIAKPDGYERLIRLEYEVATDDYYPLELGPMVEGPGSNAAGTYRITYASRPVDGYTSLDVPEGVERIIIEEASAWVRQRLNEDPKYHLDMAAALKRDLRADLRNRYGAHSRVGLSRKDRDCGRYFCELAANFVVTLGSAY